MSLSDYKQQGDPCGEILKPALERGNGADGYPRLGVGALLDSVFSLRGNV